MTRQSERSGRAVAALPVSADPVRPEDDPFPAAFAQLRPRLDAFARSLAHDRDVAEDLVQETMLRAWTARDRFEPGTSLRAWTFTILRNIFLTGRRRERFRGEYDELTAERRLASAEAQSATVELAETLRAIDRLPEAQRQPLMLVAVNGLSYGEAAAVTGLTLGTLKSRVGRARQALEALLDGRAPVQAEPEPEPKPADRLASPSAARHRYEAWRAQGRSAGRALMIG